MPVAVVTVTGTALPGAGPSGTVAWHEVWLRQMTIAGVAPNMAEVARPGLIRAVPVRVMICPAIAV